jgi:serine protease Do
MASWDAGMRSGDVLVAIDGRPVDEPNALQGAIALYRPGDRVRAIVWRDGREIEMDVELFGREDSRASEWFAELDGRSPDPGLEPEEDDVPGPGDGTPHGNVQTLDAWGLGVIELSSRISRAFDVDGGVYIMYVEKDSQADAAGVPRNAVIVSVDGSPLTAIEELKSALGAADAAGSAVVLEVVRRDGTVAFFEIEGLGG